MADRRYLCQVPPDSSPLRVAFDYVLLAADAAHRADSAERERDRLMARVIIQEEELSRLRAILRRRHISCE